MKHKNNNQNPLCTTGTIPGPVLTGTVLDSACQLWQSTCTGRGSCWVYDRTGMSLRLFLWWVAVKVVSLLFLLLAYLFYRKKGHAEVDRQEGVISRSVSTPALPFFPDDVRFRPQTSDSGPPHFVSSDIGDLDVSANENGSSSRQRVDGSRNEESEKDGSLDSAGAVELLAIRHV